MKTVKILLLSFIIALGARFATLSLEFARQNTLTSDLCNLVSLPLETGLLRETYEGLESALRARGEVDTCVGVIDNGRSFSPDCFNESQNYRTVQCKAVSNTGVRASISYPAHGLFEWPLLLWWIGATVFITVALGSLRLCADYLIKAFSTEVGAFFGKKEPKPSKLNSCVRILIDRLGISKRLTNEVEKIHSQFMIFEARVETEAIARAKSEQDANNSRQYIEKVREIRHDIRSPLSALQAVYEKVKLDGSLTTKTLATAIRRIQILSDGLNEVDRQSEPAKLVIAEVVAEETVLMLREKYKNLKSATLNISYDSDALSPILVGPKEFQSALENLLENALEAIAVGGEVNLSIQQLAGKCEVSVEDNGYGIAAENRDKIFTHGGSFGKLNGMGLGLFHTKKNIEAWGGAVSFVSLEQGTRFCISIPIMQAGVVFSGLPRDQDLKVIDDDAQVAKVLSLAGFEVTESVDTYSKGLKLLETSLEANGSILVDNKLNDKWLGTDLIAQQPRRQRVYLCTNDFDDLDVVRRARTLGVKIIPKPLCFFAPHQKGLA